MADRNEKIIAATIVSALTEKNTAQGLVMMLSGPWGCGKTFLWNNEIKEEIKKIRSDQAIVDISCFGVESISALKTQLVTKALIERGRAIKTKGFGHVFTTAKSAGLFAGAQLLKVAQKKLELDAAYIQPDLIQLLEEELIICCDDLERKSSTLSIESIMGFLRILAEQKRARILLISNEGQIDESDRETFNTYKEKTIERALHMTGSVTSAFEHFSNSPPLDKNASEYLTRNREEILRPFIASKSENIRTLRRVIADNLLILGTTLVLPDEYIEALSAFTIEFAEGKLRDSQFYDFNSIALDIRGRNKDLSEADKNRGLFLQKYFPRQNSYKFSPTLYDFVKNGFLATSALKNEVDPDRPKLTDIEEFLAELKEYDFFFLSESDVRKMVARILDKLGNMVDLSVSHLIELIIYLKIVYDILAIKFDDTLEKKVQDEINRKGALGDESFSGAVRMHYSSYSKHWNNYVATYDEELKKFKDDQTRLKVRKAIYSEDTKQLYNELYQKPENLTMLISTCLDAPFFTQFKEKPMWFYNVLEFSIDELKKYGATIIQDSAGLRQKLKIYLNSCVDDPNGDKMDNYRLGLLVKKLE